MKSAQYSYKNARELIVLVVVSNYLLVIADQSQVESALAQRDTAKVLFDQTTDQKTAGLAAAVDVLRSDVELQAREQRLIVARNNLAKQKLVLARAIGLPAGQAFDITTEVAYQPLTTSTLDEALQQAYTSRADYKSLTEQVRSAELQKKAASAERYPELSAIVDYGDIGTNPASSHGTVTQPGCSDSPFSREAGFTEITLSQIPSWQGPGNDWKTSAPASTRRFVTLSLTCKIPPRKCPLRRMPSGSLLRPCSNHVIASPRE